MSNLKLSNIFKNNYLIGASFVYVFSSFFLKGIHFLTTPIFTRVMSLEEYGNVSSAITLSSFFAIFLCCQVSASVNTAKVEFKTERFDLYIYNLAFFSIISAIILGAIILLWGKIITDFMELDTIFIVPVLISSFGMCMINLYSTYLVAMKQPKKKVFFSIYYSLFTTLLSLFVVLWSTTNKDFARISAIAIVNGIVFFYIIHNIRKNNNRKFNKSLFVADIKYALFITIPLIPHLFANLINSQADRVFIIRMLGTDSLAFYSVAYSLGMAFLALTDACLMAWNPWYYEKTKDGTQNSLIKKASSIIFVLLAFLFSIIILLAPEALSIVAPPSYITARTCVIAVAFGVFFQTLYRFPMGYETCMKNTKYTAVCTGFTAFCNVALNFMLIPILGVFGAAIATSISYIVLFLLHDYLARHVIGNFNISFKNYCVPICIVSIATIVSFISLDTLIIRFLTLLFIGTICVIIVYLLYKQDCKLFNGL